MQVVEHLVSPRRPVGCSLREASGDHVFRSEQGSEGGPLEAAPPAGPAEA